MKKSPNPRLVTIYGELPDDCEQPVAVDYDGHTVRVTFREEAGRFEVYALEVVRIGRKGKKARPITASNLRLPWAQIIDEARRGLHFRLVAQASKPLGDDELDPRMRGLFPEATPITRTRQEREAILKARRAVAAASPSGTPRGRPREHDLAQVADTYREGLKATSAPTRYVAEQLGMTRSAAAKQVAKARVEGVLEPAPGPRTAGLGKARRKGKKR